MATELGKAFVQIVPSAKGIKGSIQNQLSGESQAAGKSAGLGIASTIKKVLIGAGIGKALISTLSEGGKLEQSLGGIETLFKENANTVKEYAKEAYRTAGISANDYMENVTSFSASLLQSLGGDTAKAAEISNMAMIDMADNSNKMGTAMQDIQNAYQGFAKQNYTMLDNLKLGYGGTKKEMERLLKDAQKLTGIEYDIDNLSDVYEAIHAVQEELGITGTTAIEASETLSGSFSAVKAAFKNTLGSLALGENITPSLEGLATTVSTFLFGNLFPMVGNIIQSLPQAIGTFISAATPQFMESGSKLIRDIVSGIISAAPQIFETGLSVLKWISDGLVSGIPVFYEKLNSFTAQIPGWISEHLPGILQSGVDLILNFATGILSNAPSVLDNMGGILSNLLDSIITTIPIVLDKGFELISGLAKGILDNMPEVITSITTIIRNLIGKIVENLPNILRKGFELVGKLAMGILNNLPAIISAIWRILNSLLGELINALPKLLSSGVKLIGELARGIINSLPKVKTSIKNIGNAMIDGIKGFVGQMVSAGWDLLSGLARGIGNAIGSVVAKAKEAAAKVVSSVKGFFGISSPSKVFAGIGEDLNRGMAVGVIDSIGVVSRAMDRVGDVATRSFESDIAMNIKGSGSNIQLDSQSYVQSKEKQQQPVNLFFRFGENTFKAFVEDITNVQDSIMNLELSY